MAEVDIEVVIPFDPSPVIVPMKVAPPEPLAVMSLIVCPPPETLLACVKGMAVPAVQVSPLPRLIVLSLGSPWQQIRSMASLPPLLMMLP